MLMMVRRTPVCEAPRAVLERPDRLVPLPTLVKLETLDVVSTGEAPHAGRRPGHGLGDVNAHAVHAVLERRREEREQAWKMVSCVYQPRLQWCVPKKTVSALPVASSSTEKMLLASGADFVGLKVYSYFVQLPVSALTGRAVAYVVGLEVELERRETVTEPV
jgi:hypothetical protein